MGNPVRPKSAEAAEALGRKRWPPQIFVSLRNHLVFLIFGVPRGVSNLGFPVGGVLEMFVGSFDVVRVEISGYLPVNVANLSQNSEELIFMRLVLPEVSCCHSQHHIPVGIRKNPDRIRNIHFLR